MTAAKPSVLLWLNETGVYRDALTHAGLLDRVDLHTCRVGEDPPPDLLARCEAHAGRARRAGLLARAPRLRWIQALTAGVEGWLALPDLPARSRSPARAARIACDAGEHPGRALPPHQALCGGRPGSARAAVDAARVGAPRRARRWAFSASAPSAWRWRARPPRSRCASSAMQRIPSRCPTPIASTRRTRRIECWRQSDFVLLLLPVTPRRAMLVNARFLAQMKPTAHLLNFGRGELIDDGALVEAVTRKVIAGAVLDVFRQEPLPAEHPFWGTAGITCCRISAGCIRSATPWWRSSSWRTCGASWRAAPPSRGGSRARLRGAWPGGVPVDSRSANSPCARCKSSTACSSGSGRGSAARGTMLTRDRDRPASRRKPSE